MSITLPSWLKTAQLVCHVPDRIVFAPQRRVTFQNQRPGLLDCQGNFYPLSDCEPLRLDHLSRVAFFMTETQTLTIYHRPDLSSLGAGFVVSDGLRLKGVAIHQGEIDASRAAAELAREFSGFVTTIEN